MGLCFRHPQNKTPLAVLRHAQDDKRGFINVVSYLTS
jgi:hypothetical protein